MAKKQPDGPPADPWERRPREPANAFQAFAIYRDQGDARSLTAVARTVDEPLAKVERWAESYQWEPRAVAFAIHAARARAREDLDDRTEAADRAAQISAAHLIALAKPTEALLKKLEADPEYLDKLTPSQLFDLVVAAGRVTPRLVDAEHRARDRRPTRPGPDLPAGDVERDATIAGVGDELAHRRERR